MQIKKPYEPVMFARLTPAWSLSPPYQIFYDSRTRSFDIIPEYSLSAWLQVPFALSLRFLNPAFAFQLFSENV